MEERSAGAVVFRDSALGERLFLLLRNNGRWDFPRGNMEKGETELQTVLREVGEETGITQLSVVPGFRRVVEYFYRREGKNVHKQVVYLLARTELEEVRISSEHQGYGWFVHQEAKSKASYDNSRAVLDAAEGFLGGQGPSG